MSKQPQSKLLAPGVSPKKSWTRELRPFVDEQEFGKGVPEGLQNGDNAFRPDVQCLSQDNAKCASPVRVQLKLRLRPTGDSYEREADQVAARVTARLSGHAAEIAPVGAIQRLSSFGEMSQIEPQVEAAIARTKGNGQPLAPRIRWQMERAFGEDFGTVRIHMDAQSDHLNRSLQAKAFTTGRDIFFRRGTYLPGSPSGQKLLAHELTHVIQQHDGQAVQRAVSEVVAKTEGPLLTKELLGYGVKFKDTVTVKVNGGTDVDRVRLRRRVKRLRWETVMENGKPSDKREGSYTDGSRTNAYGSDGIKGIPKSSGSPGKKGTATSVALWEDDGPSESLRVKREQSGEIGKITVDDAPGGFIVLEEKRGKDGAFLEQRLSDPSYYSAEFEFIAQEIPLNQNSAASEASVRYENSYKNAIDGLIEARIPKPKDVSETTQSESKKDAEKEKKLESNERPAALGSPPTGREGTTSRSRANSGSGTNTPGKPRSLSKLSAALAIEKEENVNRRRSDSGSGKNPKALDDLRKC
jgi:hypothetical protein